jgi:hypothetical protein
MQPAYLHEAVLSSTIEDVSVAERKMPLLRPRPAARKLPGCGKRDPAGWKCRQVLGGEAPRCAGRSDTPCHTFRSLRG